jgi:hypothetical protein
LKSLRNEFFIPGIPNHKVIHSILVHGEDRIDTSSRGDQQLVEYAQGIIKCMGNLREHPAQGLHAPDFRVHVFQKYLYNDKGVVALILALVNYMFEDKKSSDTLHKKEDDTPMDAFSRYVIMAAERVDAVGEVEEILKEVFDPASAMEKLRDIFLQMQLNTFISMGRKHRHIPPILPNFFECTVDDIVQWSLKVLEWLDKGFECYFRLPDGIGNTGSYIFSQEEQIHFSNYVCMKALSFQISLENAKNSIRKNASDREGRSSETFHVALFNIWVALSNAHVACINRRIQYYMPLIRVGAASYIRSFLCAQREEEMQQQQKLPTMNAAGCNRILQESVVTLVTR